MAMATRNDAAKRATTIIRSFGKATAVDTSTTGLIAGAAKRKVSAAAGGVPCEMSRPAIGTEPHSQPGSASPAAPAAGTAKSWRFGTMRCTRSGDTNAAIAPLITTPRTKNGSACKLIETNSVDHSRSSSSVNHPTRPLISAAATVGMTMTVGPHANRDRTCECTS